MRAKYTDWQNAELRIFNEGERHLTNAYRLFQIRSSNGLTTVATWYADQSLHFRHCNVKGRGVATDCSHSIDVRCVTHYTWALGKHAFCMCAESKGSCTAVEHCLKVVFACFLHLRFLLICMSLNVIV